MKEKKLSFKNRLIVFFLMPCWAIIIGLLTQSLINRSWLSLDEFLIYVPFCFGFYILYPFIYKKDFSLVFLDGGQKSKKKWRFFMFHTVLWIMLGIFIGLTNYR
ncbi:hypothetical protein HXA34_18955 [Salipaludibacillus agaradhaerens]|uniref:hypothetical protein n=1 Tax=Salipaludibacillus agaradhaerens TaxID=76935 RepID=UPI0021509917|nr:hypothetical protein [Salipaludibacillus agaradhaerens]MCR6108382.1 hypothetical protein [Salipaludibacillus agaradhaerens]MCR6120405.1 hypothetical protein [Salipaludibacillus agaradhaerens]